MSEYQKLEEVISDSPSLRKRLLHLYCAHQYEEANFMISALGIANVEINDFVRYLSSK